MNGILSALTPSMFAGPLVSALIAAPLFAVLSRWVTLRKLRAASPPDPQKIAEMTEWRSYLIPSAGMGIFMVVFLVVMHLLGH